MLPDNLVAVDTNILLRGVFGREVTPLLASDDAYFCTTDTCVAEAHKNTLLFSARRGEQDAQAADLLEKLLSRMLVVGSSDYFEHLRVASSRIAWRAPQDAPLLALALTLGCPIWSEDQDFFGCGVVTWNSRNISGYLAAGPAAASA